MKASTWAVLALCAGPALPSEAAAGGDRCDVVCGAIKSETSSSEACAKARKSLPRPKIGRICQEAFEKALEFTCVEACQRHGTGRVLESRLGEACDRRRREVPRPVAHKACVDGFNAGFAATTAFIAERVELPVLVPKMDEQAKAALLERHAIILEEVAAELDFSDDTTEEAGQGGEGQEGEPQVVGESEAEVTRKEDITQMKQEWEAMRAEKTAPTLTTFSQASKAQHVDVPKLGEASQGISAGNLGSAASTAGLTARGVDKSGAGEPLREGRDKVEKSAGSGKGDSTMIKLGSEFQEVLTAEHVQGFQGASRDRSIGHQAGYESAIVPGAAGQKNKEKEGVGSEENLTIKLPNDGRFQEVLTADHVKAFHKPSSRDKPRSDPEGVGSEDNLVSELPKDGRFQEVLTVDHVKAFHKPSGRDKPRSDPEGVSSEENLVSELPKDGRFQEVLTADNVKGFQNPSSRDKPRSNHVRSSPAGGVSQTETVAASGVAGLEDFVVLGEPEPPLSTNEQIVQALSAKEGQPHEMQEGEVFVSLESEGSN